MTDLATKPGDEAAPDEPATGVATTSTAVYAWSPSAPAERPSRRKWWIGGGAVAAIAALVAASLVLIAPGTSASTVPVGWQTTGGAAESLRARLDATTVTIGGQSVSARDLGASVDATAAADAAHAEHPLWNPATWFQTSSAAQIVLDADIATAKLRTLLPTMYAPAVDAAVAFDPASNSYAVTPGVTGEQVDLGALRLAIQRAFDGGETSVAITAAPAAVAPAADTSEAGAVAARLNAMLGTIGFYVGDERTVPIDPATAASWITVKADDTAGDFVVTADPGKIQTVVATLPGLINRPVVNATVITNSAGDHLTDVTPGADGRTLGDLTHVAHDFAAQLATGDPKFLLSVATVPFTTVTLYRHIEVDISDQTAYLWENNVVVATYLVSTGLPNTPTPEGNFTVFAHVPIQDMGCQPDSAYCTKDVPWVTYFAPDVGFHGAYWHNNFGNEMSHGCVNMPVDVAEFVYNWAPDGMEVEVHD